MYLCSLYLPYLPVSLFACLPVCLLCNGVVAGRNSHWCFSQKKKEVALGWEVGLGCWGLSALSYPAPVGRNGVRVGAWGMGHGVFR